MRHIRRGKYKVGDMVRVLHSTSGARGKIAKVICITDSVGEHRKTEVWVTVEHNGIKYCFSVDSSLELVGWRIA